MAAGRCFRFQPFQLYPELPTAMPGIDGTHARTHARTHVRTRACTYTRLRTQVLVLTSEGSSSGSVTSATQVPPPLSLFYCRPRPRRSMTGRVQ